MLTGSKTALTLAKLAHLAIYSDSEDSLEGGKTGGQMFGALSSSRLSFFCSIYWHRWSELYIMNRKLIQLDK